MAISGRCCARGEDWAGGQQQVDVEQGDASCCHGDVVPELRGRCGLAGVAAMPCHWGEHLIVGSFMDVQESFQEIGLMHPMYQSLDSCEFLPTNFHVLPFVSPNTKIESFFRSMATPKGKESNTRY